MPRAPNFIDDFQKDHSELLGLIRAFHSAIAYSNKSEANEILNRIDSMIDSHFSFEESYFYPRLQRLVREITGRLLSDQKDMREFICKSRRTLSKDRITKADLDSLLAMIPRLSKFFEDCGKITFLAESFDDEEKEYLHKRFKERSKEEKRLILG